jgi:hypothetical protein
MKLLSQVWNAIIKFVSVQEVMPASSNHPKMIKARVGFLDRMLLKEYERLKHALEQEDDPVRQDMIIDDMLEVEEAMRKRAALAEYLKES